MRYRNKLTGNVIDVPCPVSGPDWETIPDNTAGEGAKAPKKRRKAAEKAAETSPEEERT